MPYQKNKDLPDTVQNNLPSHAQDIYREAFNHAWKEYNDPNKRREGAPLEETAHRVAWAAVKQSYEKQNDQWVVKDKES